MPVTNAAPAPEHTIHISKLSSFLDPRKHEFVLLIDCEHKLMPSLCERENGLMPITLYAEEITALIALHQDYKGLCILDLSYNQLKDADLQDVSEIVSAVNHAYPSAMGILNLSHNLSSYIPTP